MICCHARTMGVHLASAEFVMWFYKVASILTESDSDVTAKDFAAALPAIEDMVVWANAGLAAAFCHSMQQNMNLFVLTAEACAKLEMYDEALMFAEQASTNTDFTQGGSFLPTILSDGFRVQGRCLASIGKAKAAEEAFESALTNLSGFGLFFLEVLVLRDLKVYVLDHAGRNDEGTKRLKVSIQQLLGATPPAEQLAELQVALGSEIDLQSVLA